MSTGAKQSPADDVLEVIADGIRTVGSNTIYGGDTVVVLAPVVARNIAAGGFSKADAIRELMRRSVRKVRDVARHKSVPEHMPLHWSHLVEPNNPDALVPMLQAAGRSTTTLLVRVPAGEPSLIGAALDAGAAGVVVPMVGSREDAERGALDDFQLMPSADEDLTHVEARPGNVLVPVRKPGTLAHLTAALRAAGDRDVVAMTVRLIGVDVPDDLSSTPHTTDDERRLLSAVVALAERESRPVRLLIVPGLSGLPADKVTSPHEAGPAPHAAHARRGHAARRLFHHDGRRYGVTGRR